MHHARRWVLITAYQEFDAPHRCTATFSRRSATRKHAGMSGNFAAVAVNLVRKGSDIAVCIYYYTDVHGSGIVMLDVHVYSVYCSRHWSAHWSWWQDGAREKTGGSCPISPAWYHTVHTCFESVVCCVLVLYPENKRFKTCSKCVFIRRYSLLGYILKSVIRFPMSLTLVLELAFLVFLLDRLLGIWLLLSSRK